MQTATATVTETTTALHPVTVLTMFLLLYDRLSATFMEEYGRISAEMMVWARANLHVGGRMDRVLRQSPMWADMCALQQRARDFALSNGLDLDAVETAIRNCVITSNPQGLAVIWYGDEDGGPSTQVLTANEITRYMYMPAMLVENLETFQSYAKELVDANGVVTCAMAKRWLAELEDGQLTTVEELEAQEKEREFRALERLAHEVAATVKGGMSTTAFIAKVHSLIQREEDRRYGLQEDGLCACSTMNRGTAMEEWYDMRDESSSRSATYGQLLDWFSRECPLIWAKYEEARLAGNLGDQDDGE
jgi:hypothetical protein